MRSNFYFALKKKPIDAEMVRLKALIQQIFNESKGSAGARTISAVVTLQHDIKLTRYKARKLMQDMGLQSRQKKHKYKHRDEKHTVFDNVLNREFYPTAPNQVWTGDVTYVRIKGGFCYLAVVIDLFSRRIVGFKVSDLPDSKLTSDALKMAYATRLQPQGVLFHSDQGVHYTSKEYANALRDCKSMKHSMSRKGNCWDNAPTERFFRSFKHEWMPNGSYNSIKEAKQDISNYILDYYQRRRPHRHNDYLTPVEKERRFFSQTSY